MPPTKRGEKNRRRHLRGMAAAGASATSAALSIAGASGAVGVASAVLGALGALGPAVGAVYAAFQERQNHRVALLLSEAYLENAADEGFGAYIAAQLQDARVRRVLLESVRTALEAVSEEVLPALAALMREYERTGMDTDARFRAVCRVLQELSPEDYSCLRALFQAASSSLAGCERIAFVKAVKQQPIATQRIVAAGIQPDRSLHLVEVQGCGSEVFPRLSHLLYVHNIGDKSGSFGAVALDDEAVYDEVLVSSTVVEWMACILHK